MAEKLILVCDLDGRPAASQALVQLDGKRFVLDLCFSPCPRVRVQGSSASSWSQARPALFAAAAPTSDGKEAGRKEASGEEVHGEAEIHGEAEVHLCQMKQTLAPDCCYPAQAAAQPAGR